MSKTSFIIPCRNEQNHNLEKTIYNIKNNATGDYEIIVGFDGPPYLEIPGITSLRFPNWVGIKTVINSLAASATGKYIFKLDAHCSISKGINEVLEADMKDDWIVMPRFYVLNGRTWEWQDNRHYDYFYLSCPFTDPRGFRFKAGGHWPQRTAERENDHRYDIDVTPQIHGSGWFMTKDHFFELGGFPLVDVYGHAQEPLWLALSNQLSGHKVVINKKAWYAHLHQDTRDKGFALGHHNEEKTYNLVANHFMKDPRMHDWIKSNMPMPSWPENWEERLKKYQEENK